MNIYNLSNYYDYVNGVHRFVNNFLEGSDDVVLSGIIDNIKSLTDQWRYLLGKSGIRNIFTEVGVTENNDEIRLLFDAAILNYIFSDLNLLEDSLFDKMITSGGRITFSMVDFPSGYLFMLQQICNQMKCGNNGVYKFNIVALWTFMAFYINDFQHNDEHFKSFVKLMLDMDLNAYLEWKGCKQNMLELFENLNKYKQKLPLEVQRFLTKISGKDKFCKMTSEYIQFEQLLYDYVNGVRKFVNNFLEGSDDVVLSGIIDNIKSLTDQWRYLFGKSDIRNIFTEVGVTENNDEIRLLFDAAILNYIFSDLNLLEDSLFDKMITSGGRSTFSIVDFPSGYLFMLQQGCSQMKCGNNGVYKFNIVALWTFMAFYINDFQHNDEHFKSFVKLMLDMDLNAYLEWKGCKQNMLELFENLNKYKQKLPLEVQRFLTKISGKDKFCKMTSEYIQFEQLLYDYVNDIRRFVSKFLESSDDRGLLVIIDNIKSLTDQWRYLFGKSDIRNIFTEVGVTENNDEIRLLFDAAILNYIFSDLNLLEDSLFDKMITSGGRSTFSMVDFPSGYLFMLQQICNQMKCGNNGVYKFNIVALWTFMAFYINDFQHNDERFEPFVKLMLGHDIPKYEDWISEQHKNE